MWLHTFIKQIQRLAEAQIGLKPPPIEERCGFVHVLFYSLEFTCPGKKNQLVSRKKYIENAHTKSFKKMKVYTVSPLPDTLLRFKGVPVWPILANHFLFWLAVVSRMWNYACSGCQLKVMPIIEDVTVYLPSDAGYYNSTRFELWKLFSSLMAVTTNSHKTFVCTIYSCVYRGFRYCLGSEANGYDYVFF